MLSPVVSCSRSHPAAVSRAPGARPPGEQLDGERSAGPPWAACVGLQRRGGGSFCRGCQDRLALLERTWITGAWEFGASFPAQAPFPRAVFSVLAAGSVLLLAHSWQPDPGGQGSGLGRQHPWVNELERRLLVFSAEKPK